MVDDVNEANSNERRNSVGLLNLFIIYDDRSGRFKLQRENALQNNQACIVTVHSKKVLL